MRVGEFLHPEAEDVMHLPSDSELIVKFTSFGQRETKEDDADVRPSPERDFKSR